MNYLIRLYQRYISPLKPQACRYYPTCSEYALLEFKYDFWPYAFIKSVTRILSCNQLFAGGIDHPKIKIHLHPVCDTQGVKKIVTWYVPTGKKNQYYVVKNFKGI